MSDWRLIIDGLSEGARNMAVDRAMLDAHAEGEAQPTLRLYGWRRPTVSLGRFQPAGDVDGAACRRYGVESCRRPTGGRGVLHDDEITYSIVAGVRDGIPRGVSASYKMLCAALVVAFRELGIDAALTARSRGARDSGACYLHATPADLTLGAAKLSGSAQVWAGESCLQHGSFVMSRNVEREADIFRLNERGRADLERSTDTIEGALGARPDLDAVRAAVVRGVEQGLGARLSLGALSDAEERAAALLVEGFRID